MLTMQLTQAGRAHRDDRRIVSSFAAAMMLAATIPFVASNAKAAPEGRVKSLSFELSATAGIVNEPIRIVSEDGERWTRFKEGNRISFDGNMRLVMKGTGRIRGYAIYLGLCRGGGHDCLRRGNSGAHTVIDNGDFGGGPHSIEKNLFFHVETSKIAAMGFGDGIIRQCNDALSKDKEIIHEAHHFTAHFPVTVGFDTYIGSWNTVPQQAVSDDPHALADIDKSRTITVGIPVMCEPVARSSDIKAPPKILEANLGLTTSGDTCPKPAKARVIIATEAPRTVFYKIRRGPIYTTADWIKGETKEVANLLGTGKSALLDATHELGKLDPGYTTYRLVIQDWGTTPDKGIYVGCPPFKVTSAWLKYDIEDKATCPKKVVEIATFYTTRPGMVPYEIKHHSGLVFHSGQVEAKRYGDKYVATHIRLFPHNGAFQGEIMADVKNSPANSGWVPLKIDCLETLSGKLTLQSLGATSCKGEALVAIHTNGAGELPYELECGPGKSWQRKVTAMANKIGVDKVQFDVTNNELVTCVLRTRIGGVLKPLDGGSKTFQCHTPIDAGASVDLVPQTRPDPQKPTKPVVVVDPVKPDPRKPVKPSVVVADPKPETPVVSEPKIGCANGKVKDGACTCEPNFKPVNAGKNAWRCVRSVADPKPLKPTVTQPKISCANGTAKNGACNCDRMHKPVKVGKNAWRCVRVVADPLKDRSSANKVELKTAPKKTAKPKFGADKPTGLKGTAAKRPTSLLAPR